MTDYRRNHYVPIWYQDRFFSGNEREKKFCYLDLRPDSVVSNGHRYVRKSLLPWGPERCFCEKDLYTTRFGDWESTEIEQEFFGQVDSMGKAAVEFFSVFDHSEINHDAFQALLPYMSIQKLRTPKGLSNLSKLIKTREKNRILIGLQELQYLYCAIWAESVWALVDASESGVQFLLSDHPVTVYNLACFPGSEWCRGTNDPDIWQNGTHTIFPLSSTKALILTNLSWVRSPYSNPIKNRPNPNPLRNTLFNFTGIQVGRMLTALEVHQMNFIIKARASRYIASVNREWLYPERHIGSPRWDHFGKNYLFMPDPRSVTFSSQTLIGYENGRSDAFDAYGRKPHQKGYDDKAQAERERNSFLAFQGEFARLFGPRRRGVSFEFGGKRRDEDPPDYHKYHLSLEAKYKGLMRR